MTKAKPLPKLLAPSPVILIPGTMLCVNVPMPPPRRANPNAAVHHLNRHYWRKKFHRRAREATEAVIADTAGEFVSFPPDTPINVAVIVGWEKGHIVQDMDNTWASCKGALDGISEAIGVDDKFFRPTTLEQVRDADGHGWTRFVLSVEG